MPTRGGRRTCRRSEALVAEVGDAELFLYPGSGHLFADPSLSDEDEAAAALLKGRTLAFLNRW
jgi:dienelactone hydrolase